MQFDWTKEVDSASVRAARARMEIGQEREQLGSSQGTAYVRIEHRIEIIWRCPLQCSARQLGKHRVAVVSAACVFAVLLAELEPVRLTESLCLFERSCRDRLGARTVSRAREADRKQTGRPTAALV